MADPLVASKNRQIISEVQSFSGTMMPTRPERRHESLAGLEQDMNGIRLDSFLHIAYLCMTQT